jgi:hypothetical protein
MNDRRDFLKDLCRLTLFGGLVAGITHLSLLPKSEETTGEECNRNDTCGKCPLLKKCEYPSARSFKEVVE